MATSAITNTIKDASGTAVSGVVVTARLRPGPGFRVGDATEVAGQVTTTSNGSGVWTLNLERVANISPTNSYWEIEEDIPEAQGGRKTYAITVGSGNATVYGSLLGGLLPAATVPTALTLAAGDARYDLLSNIVFNAKTYGASGNGVTDDTAALAAGLVAAEAVGGTLYIPAGTYILSGELSITASVHIVGAGMGHTIIKGGIGSGFMLKRFGTGSTISDITVSDLTLDVNNVASASAIGVEYVNRFTLARLRVANVASGWGAFIGVLNGADNVARNNGVLVEDCVFDGQGSTTEQILVFNSARVTLRRNYHTSIGASAWAIGLYQNLDRVLIVDCEFASVVGNGIYYCVSCNNITIQGCRFPLGALPISGARQSDNGAFAALRVSGLRLIDCRFASGVSGTAVELGAVRDAKVIGCEFIQCKEIALGIHNGDTPVNTAPDHIQVIGCTFRNNNQAATVHIIHPAVSVTSTGNLYLQFIGCDFLDDQGTKTQRYPVTFEGAVTPAFIDFIGCQMLADTANSGTSIAINDGAAVGANVRLIGCRDVSATLPAGVQSFRSAGYNPKGSVTAPTFPATTVAVTNTTGVDVTAFITNSTSAITQVTVGGTGTGMNIDASKWAAVRIPAGQTIAFTYAGGTPTWTWMGD